MFIAPIRPMGLKNQTSVNFGSRHKNDTDRQEYAPSKTQGTTDLGKMPVIVLLATVPLNSTAEKINNIAEKNSAPETEIGYTKEIKSEPSTYVIAPKTQENQQSKLPFGYQGLRNDAVKMVHNFKIKGENCHLVLTSAATKKNSNIVDNAYIIYDNKKVNPNKMETPPEIKRLIFHDIGKDKEFCGAIIDEDIIGNDDRYKGTIRKEVKLDDETAQIIIDLITGYSKFKNESIIKLEEVQTPQLHPVKIYE